MQHLNADKGYISAYEVNDLTKDVLKGKWLWTFVCLVKHIKW